MNLELEKVVQAIEVAHNIKIDHTALSQLAEYSNTALKKLPEGMKEKWDTSGIEAVLLESAIRIAQQQGENTISKRHIELAILIWHPTGDPDQCYGAGLRIIEVIKDKAITFAVKALLQFASRSINK